MTAYELVPLLTLMQHARIECTSASACTHNGVFVGVPDDATSTCKLAWAVYRGVLHALPASARAWFGDLRDRGLSASIEVSHVPQNGVRHMLEMTS